MNIQPLKVAKLLEIIDGNLQFGDLTAELSAIGQDGVSFVFKNKLPTNANVLVTNNQITLENANNYTGHIQVPNPRLAFAQLLTYLAQTEVEYQIDQSAIIADSAKIAETVKIGPNVVIEANVTIGPGSVIAANSVIMAGTKIGANVQLKPSVTIYPNSSIGDNTIIHASAVIGADGFGYELMPDKTWFKIPHLGQVKLGFDVEIGAGTTIDRGTVGLTEIHSGVKIDNQCQIGHNVIIGANTIISGCSAIAGSTKIAENVIIGGKVAISDHLSICSGAIIKGASTVLRDITAPGVYGSSIHVLPNNIWNKCMLALADLPKITKIFKKLEQLNEH